MSELTVSVYGARNLIKTDIISQVNAFLKLNFQNQQFQTEVIKNNLNPVWNESLYIFVY
jgi:Ca2+-dependent lipid-binding protein